MEIFGKLTWNFTGLHGVTSQNIVLLPYIISYLTLLSFKFTKFVQLYVILYI
jgi:hypothetical protein